MERSGCSFESKTSRTSSRFNSLEISNRVSGLDVFKCEILNYTRSLERKGTDDGF